MKNILLILLLVFSVTPIQAEYYDITITRTDHNTYYVDDWSDEEEYWEIITYHCFEQAYEDQAILWYSWLDYEHYLFFPNGETCDVEKALDIIPYY